MLSFGLKAYKLYLEDSEESTERRLSNRSFLQQGGNPETSSINTMVTYFQ